MACSHFALVGDRGENQTMTTVLIADDSTVDRHLAGRLLEKQLGINVAYAADGREARTAIDAAPPDLVLTDLQMPHMNGLELVEHVRRHYPSVPVILMTAHGSEEIASQALQKGAASYVPKRSLTEDLPETVKTILAVATAGRQQQRLLECLAATESRFVLENDSSLLTQITGYVEAGLKRMKLCDDSARLRVTVALQEALVNALVHGNLEVDSALRDQNCAVYHELIEARRHQAPYCDRRIHVEVRESRSEAVYVVRDEGPGFDPSTLPDPTDPANLEKCSGRGLLLIRTFMDQVEHGDQGREITMIKRCESNASRKENSSCSL
jgi:CheY-like chemotaxis protein